MARAAALSAGLTLSFSPLAAADTARVTPKMDCTLYAEDGGRANCAGTGLFVGETAAGAARRSLLAFDVQRLVPGGSSISSATLSLAMTRSRAVDGSVSLHRVLAAWSEGTSAAVGQGGGGTLATPLDATWVFRSFDTSSWTTPGGDFELTPVATQGVSSTVQRYTWSSPSMVADVQRWLDTPADNLGWILIGDESMIQTARRFGSREAAPDERPQLDLVFTPIGPTGACCAADGECSVVLDPGAACGGAYQGVATQCTADLCPRPPGACCLQDVDATCEIQSQAECTARAGNFRGEMTTCSPNPCLVQLTPFVDKLPLPRVAQPVSGLSGAEARYRISMVEKRQILHSQLPATTVWAYDDGNGGTFPGPTIEARKDHNVEVQWVNNLRDSSGALRTEHLLPVDQCPHGAQLGGARTVVHLHGGHVAAEYDGYPELTILPGETTTYQYPNWQDAAMLWYHDHALGITRLNVMLGLAGLYIIRDDAEAALNLPSGEFEVPLVIQDRSFNLDGSFRYPAVWMEHFFGDKMLVNGKVWPYLNVKRGTYRFRVLNGSGSRFLTLALSNGMGFQVISSEGGLLRGPVALTQLTLGPAERADLIVDFSAQAPGTEILLTNSAATPFPQGGTDAALPNVMKFIVQDSPGPTSPIPSKLREIAAYVEQDAVLTRDFQLAQAGDACSGQAWLINGLRWDDITERPRLGTSEIWRFVNRSGTSHPMHMHMLFFQVLDRQPIQLIDGEPVPIGSRVPPPPEEAGWKDTVQVAPFEAVRVMARFEDFVGKFAYHCHILEHEDQAMMRQYETYTECGDGARGLPVEECDDGAESPTCNSDCTRAACGDGVLNRSSGEGCDDGNTLSGDGCSNNCQVEAACTDCDAGADAGTKPRSGAAADACSCRTPGAGAGGRGAGQEQGGGLLALGLLSLLGLRRRRVAA